MMKNTFPRATMGWPAGVVSVSMLVGRLYLHLFLFKAQSVALLLKFEYFIQQITT
jgi:hypothetical protein